MNVSYNNVGQHKIYITAATAIYLKVTNSAVHFRYVEILYVVYGRTLDICSLGWGDQSYQLKESPYTTNCIPANPKVPNTKN